MSSSSIRRNALLSAAVIILGGLVVLDRFASRTSDPDQQRSSVGAAHRDAAALLAEERALIDAQPAIEAARDEARATWATIEAGLVRASQINVARAQHMRGALQDAIERDVIGQITFQPVAASRVDADASVQSIVERVSFDVATPALAYALLDRLAHIPAMRTRLRDVQLIGPGIRESLGQRIRVQVTVEAFALVSESASG